MVFIYIYIYTDNRDLTRGFHRPSLVLFIYVQFVASLSHLRIWQAFSEELSSDIMFSVVAHSALQKHYSLVHCVISNPALWPIRG